jgi:hypothetical protein
MLKHVTTPYYQSKTCEYTQYTWLTRQYMLIHVKKVSINNLWSIWNTFPIWMSLLSQDGGSSMLWQEWHPMYMCLHCVEPPSLFGCHSCHKKELAPCCDRSDIQIGKVVQKQTHIHPAHTDILAMFIRLIVQGMWCLLCQQGNSKMWSPLNSWSTLSTQHLWTDWTNFLRWNVWHVTE